MFASAGAPLMSEDVSRLVHTCGHGCPVHACGHKRLRSYVRLHATSFIEDAAVIVSSRNGCGCERLEVVNDFLVAKI